MGSLFFSCSPDVLTPYSFLCNMRAREREFVNNFLLLTSIFSSRSQLNSDLIPQYAQSGHLDFLQEMMTVSGSSMVMSKVDVSEDVSIFDLLDEISDASFTFPSPELSPTWALREASKTSAFSIDAVKETIAGGLTATVLVPLYISDANEVIRSVEDATGSIDHVSIVAALNPFATGDHRSGGGRKLPGRRGDGEPGSGRRDLPPGLWKEH